MIVVRRWILGEPSPAEQPSDVIGVQGTVIKAGQENSALSDVVGTLLRVLYGFHPQVTMQWEAVENKTEEVFCQRIPILLVPFNELTPEEEATRDQQGPYDRLMMATNFDRGLYEGSELGQDDYKFEAPPVDHSTDVQSLSALSVGTASFSLRVRNTHLPFTFRFKNG